MLNYQRVTSSSRSVMFTQWRDRSHPLGPGLRKSQRMRFSPRGRQRNSTCRRTSASMESMADSCAGEVGQSCYYHVLFGCLIQFDHSTFDVLYSIPVMGPTNQPQICHVGQLICPFNKHPKAQMMSSWHWEPAPWVERQSLQLETQKNLTRSCWFFASP